LELLTLCRLSYATSLVTLIVAAGQLLDLNSPSQTAGAMVGVIIVITLANVLGGVKVMLPFNIRIRSLIFSFSYTEL
jgi:hypothetical protein